MVISTHKSVYVLALILMLLGLFFSPAVVAKSSPIAELKKAGLYGRVHAWNSVSLKSHNIDVVVPKNAPIIISDYHSAVGANGLGRSGMHRGTDIFAETGSPIIAAADGRVIRAKVDRCWGPTLLISHGLDATGKPFYGLYGHVRNIKVKVGQLVKRGQQVAEMGEDIFTTCGAGIHHLHFQISYNPRKIPLLGWGWANFVGDGMRAPNPHKYWENGAGKITCFEEGKKYSPSGLTYPVPCNQGSDQKKASPVLIAKTAREKALSQKLPAIETLFQEFVVVKLADDKASEEDMGPTMLDKEFAAALKWRVLP